MIEVEWKILLKIANAFTQLFSQQNEIYRPSPQLSVLRKFEDLSFLMDTKYMESFQSNKRWKKWPLIDERALSYLKIE